MYFRWNVERRCRIGPGSEPKYRECQGKNARQSHPEIPSMWISCHAPTDWSRTSCPRLNQLSHTLWQRYVRNVTLEAKFLFTTSTIPENLEKLPGVNSRELVFLKLTQNYTALSF